MLQFVRLFKLNKILTAVAPQRSYNSKPRPSHLKFDNNLNSRLSGCKHITRIASSSYLDSRFERGLSTYYHKRSFVLLSTTQQLLQKKQFGTDMANAAEEFRHLDYAQLMEIKSKEQHVLIDVREKSELLETGSIPGAYHIPVGEIEKALSMSDDEFKKTYKFDKPFTDDQVVFSCRSGKRSFMALEKALAKGYTKAKHYKGGWLDWEQNTKK